MEAAGLAAAKLAAAGLGEEITALELSVLIFAVGFGHDFECILSPFAFLKVLGHIWHWWGPGVEEVANLASKRAGVLGGLASFGLSGQLELGPVWFLLLG